MKVDLKFKEHKNVFEDFFMGIILAETSGDRPAQCRKCQVAKNEHKRECRGMKHARGGIYIGNTTLGKGSLALV